MSIGDIALCVIALCVLLDKGVNLYTIEKELREINYNLNKIANKISNLKVGDSDE